MNTLLVAVAVVALAAAAFSAWVAWMATSRERALSEARVRALARAIEGDAAGLFTSTTAGSDTLRRLVPALAAGAIIVSTTVGAALAVGGAHGSREVADEGTELAPTPLELVSLEHVRGNGQVTVRGVVRNPIEAPELDGLCAVVSLVDANGRNVGLAESPLEVAKLAAGQESRFSVSESVRAGAVRYRLSFRHGEGGVIAHVDRRRGVLK